MTNLDAITKLDLRDMNNEPLDVIEKALLRLYTIDDPEYKFIAAEGATEYALICLSVVSIDKQVDMINKKLYSLVNVSS